MLANRQDTLFIATRSEAIIGFCDAAAARGFVGPISVAEVSVLARNPIVDATTHDLVAYFQRYIQTRQDHINLGFIAAQPS